MEIKPDYRRSVYNVPHTILNNFGIKTGRAMSGFSGSDRIILVLVDALGTYFVPKLPDTSKFTIEEITSTFPSTTAAAVTSMFTGLSPKEHGILEWYMLYECTENVIKTIPYTPAESNVRDLLAERCDPSMLFGLNTVFESLAEKGVKSSAYIRDEYRNSLYSQFMMRGATVNGYQTKESIPQLITKDNSDFIYVYIDSVDSTQHRYGPQSQNAYKEVQAVWKMINDIVKNTNEYDVFVVADHGQVEIKTRSIMDVPDNCPVGGSPRDVFMYCDYVPEGFQILDKRKIIDLLGPADVPAHRNIEFRVPTHVILPPENTGLWFQDFTVKGLHGGLSEQEMLVPLMVHSK